MKATISKTIEQRRAEVQKVADAYGMTVYLYATSPTSWEAYTREQPGRTLTETIEPVDAKLTPAADHGLGENTAHEYATPKGDGRKL